MEIHIPSPVRGALYILTVIGSPIIGYLAVTGHIGPNEVALWSALTTAVAAMARFNLTPEDQSDN